MFKSVISYTNSEKSLNRLQQWLVPAIKQHFEGGDPELHLTALKRILRVLEPFFKKVLFIADAQKYEAKLKNRKGLDLFVKQLPKVSSTLQDLDLAKDRKRIYTAHEAVLRRYSNYSITQMNEITQCIPKLYLFAIEIYYKELETNMQASERP